MRNFLAILGWYAAISVLTFAVYAMDKWMAKGDGRRIPEKVLHFLEAIGGWPGAFLAMRIVNHKSRKKSFLLIFWLIVAAHIAGWLLYWFWWRTDR